MARYIDADIAKNLILNDMAQAEREGKDLNGYTDALFRLKTIHTANVAPIADTVRKMVDRLDKHFCHDPAFLGVEQRMIMAIIDRIAREIVVEIQNETN